MGAEEEPETKSKSVESIFGETAEAMLDRGYRIDTDESGQLRLIAPPTYGEPPSAA